MTIDKLVKTFDPKTGQNDVFIFFGLQNYGSGLEVQYKLMNSGYDKLYRLSELQQMAIDKHLELKIYVRCD